MPDCVSDPRRGSTPARSKHAAAAGLTLGLLIAVAANLTYAVPRGPVVIGLGLVAPLVLPVVLLLRTTFAATGWVTVALREVSTLAVAGPAVAVSYWHTYELVLSAGEPRVLALLAPLSSDGLAGLATLALHRMRVTARGAARPRSAPSRPLSPPEPAPSASTDPVLSVGSDRAVLLATASELQMQRRADGQRPLGREKLAKELGITPAVARSLIEEIDAESPMRLVASR